MLDKAHKDVMDWFDRLYTVPEDGEGSAWQSQRLEYKSKVSSFNGGKTSLVAPEYRNGELDWYHFMVEGVPEQLNGNFNTRCFTPTCIEIPGMPVRRWWEFEDGNVDLGDLNVESVDLAKMALMDFVFVYGDDWFLVPLTVPIGSLTRSNEIEVNDVFGVKTPITKRSRDSDGSPLDHWDMLTVQTYTVMEIP